MTHPLQPFGASRPSAGQAKVSATTLEKLDGLGGGAGNRTRVLRCKNRASTGVV